MGLSGQFQFFLCKNFKCTETQIKQKPTDKTKLSKQKTEQGNSFWCIKTSKRGIIVYFVFSYFFVHLEFFCKKKIDIVLITSFTILLKYMFRQSRTTYLEESKETK